MAGRGSQTASCAETLTLILTLTPVKVAECITYCESKNQLCDGVNIVPLNTPPKVVFPAEANVPWGTPVGQPWKSNCLKENFDGTKPVSSWYECAKDNKGTLRDQGCMFQGTRKVQFGTGDTWKTINATDEIDCSKGAFGVSKKTKGGICRLDGSEDRVDHNMSICYPLKMNADRGRGNPPWTIIKDDAEDAVWYSSCFKKDTGWKFVGNPPCPACTGIVKTTPKWRYGDYCISCNDQKALSTLPPASIAYPVANYTVAERCEMCQG